jgi:hypothetical protein
MGPSFEGAGGFESLGGGPGFGDFLEAGFEGDTDGEDLVFHIFQEFSQGGLDIGSPTLRL